jgi:hypothetical protein
MAYGLRVWRLWLNKGYGYGGYGYGYGYDSGYD